MNTTSSKYSNKNAKNTRMSINQPKYSNSEPEFYLPIIKQFGTEENANLAEMIITKQFIRANNYRTRVCDKVLNKKQDKIWKSYFAKGKNWKINQPDEHSVWYAENIETKTKSKKFRLCQKSCCFNAHNRETTRKAVCIFNLFNVCNKSEKECGYIHVSFKEFDFASINMPLFEEIPKLVDDYLTFEENPENFFEYKDENGNKLFKVFYYTHQVRIWNYNLNKTFILYTDNYFVESISNTEEEILNNKNLLQRVLIKYFSKYFSSNNTIFKVKNKNDYELSFYEFIFIILSSELNYVFESCYMNECTQNTVLSTFIQSNINLNYFDILLNTLLSDLQDNNYGYSLVTAIIQKNNIFPLCENSLSIYQLKFIENQCSILFSLIDTLLNKNLSCIQSIESRNRLVGKIVGMFKESENIKYDYYIFRFTKYFNCDKSNLEQVILNNFSLQNQIFPLVEVVIEALDVIISGDEESLISIAKLFKNSLEIDYNIKNIQHEDEEINNFNSNNVSTNNQTIVNDSQRSATPNYLERPSIINSSISLNNEPSINGIINEEEVEEEVEEVEEKEVEVKPVESKLIEVKPVEIKPAEVKNKKYVHSIKSSLVFKCNDINDYLKFENEFKKLMNSYEYCKFEKF